MSRRPGGRSWPPPRTLLTLATGWLVVQVVAWQLHLGGRTRIGLAVLSIAALPPALVLLGGSPRRGRSGPSRRSPSR